MILSLDQPAFDNDDGQALSLSEMLEDTGAASVLEQVEEEEMRERLMNSLKALSRREQVLLSLYYTEGLTMREVADVMEISQTRVCQIHARSILTLKALMTPPKAAAVDAEPPTQETPPNRPESPLLRLESRPGKTPAKRRARSHLTHHWSESSNYSQRFDSG